MVKCQDCYHSDKRTAKTDVRGYVWGRCQVQKGKRLKLDKERACEDFTDVSIDDLFMSEEKAK